MRLKIFKLHDFNARKQQISATLVEFLLMESSVRRIIFLFQANPQSFVLITFISNI